MHGLNCSTAFAFDCIQNSLYNDKAVATIDIHSR